MTAGRAAVDRGAVFMRTARFAEAEAEFRTAADTFEANGAKAELAVALNNLGTVLAEQGETARALPVLRRASFLRPDAIEILGNIANLHLRLGETAKAAPLVVAIFAAQDSRSDYRPWSWALRAELRLVRGDLAGAGEDAEAAMDQRIEDPRMRAGMYNLRGRLALRAKRWLAAAEDFSIAIGLLAGAETLQMAGYLENYAIALRQIKAKGGAAAAATRSAKDLRRRLGLEQK